jgi:phage-related protein
MLVNGVDILATYKAKLLSKEIQPAEITIYDDWLRNALNPLYLGKQETFKTIKLQILIADTTDSACLHDISNLLSQMRQCVIKFDDVDFYYACTVSSVETSRLMVAGYFVINVEFKSGYAYLAEVTETLNGVDHIHITALGNLPSPVKLTVTPSMNLASITITGFAVPITISSLTSGVAVVIDGEACTALQNGANKFGSIDMWEFPALQPGANTISVDTTNCVITVKYKPKYL